MKAIFHPEAQEEMIESARFFEGRLEGFGLDFLKAVEVTTRRIEQSPKQVRSTERTFESDSYPVFLSRFFTKYSLIASSSQPLCIKIAGPVTGGNACRQRH